MPRHPPNALKRLIQSQPSHTENKAPIHDHQPRLYSALHLFYPPGHSSNGPPQGRPPLALTRSEPTATARQPAQTASRIPIHNVKEQKPEDGGQKSVTTSAPTSDLSRSSQHGTVSTRSDRSPPALPSARFVSASRRSHQLWWSRTLEGVWSALGGAGLLLSVGSGGADRDRTGDLLLAKQALSQLSYGPEVRSQIGGPGKI